MIFNSILKAALTASFIQCAIAFPLEGLLHKIEARGTYSVVNVDGGAGGTGGVQKVTQTVTITQAITQPAVTVTITTDGLRTSYYDDGLWKPPYYTLVSDGQSNQPEPTAAIAPSPVIPAQPSVQTPPPAASASQSAPAAPAVSSA